MGGGHGNGHEERLALSGCRKTHWCFSRRRGQPETENTAPVQGFKAIFVGSPAQEIRRIEHLRTRLCCRRKGLFSAGPFKHDNFGDALSLLMT